MFNLNFKGILLIYVVIFNQNYAKSETVYKQNKNPNIMQTIMSDMQKAFCSITNNTNILTKMYDFESSKMDISTMAFELPNTGNEAQPEKLIFMNRREFMAPTFPNLTETYMALRRFKVSKTPLENADLNITELMRQEIQSIVQGYVNDAWSNMGLDGWKGEIADPLYPIDKNNKYSPSILNDYPHDEIIKDLNKGQINNNFQDITTNKLMENNEDNERIKKDMDNNVFIARANDPFGYSTNWQKRNASQTKYKRDVLRLYSMIRCSTGCDPLVYKGYGCYCGFLGDGIPTDGIDRCCKVHDKCYEQSNCISYLEYFVPYVWKCYRGKPLCAIDHGEWGGPQSCAARLCYCDLRLSRCLRQYACPGRRAVCRSSASRRLQNFLLVR